MSASTDVKTRSPEQTEALSVYKKIFGLINDHIFGHRDNISTILTAFFAGGHVLLEDYPGSGKSYLAEWLGRSILDDMREGGWDIPPYKRIQCTPDLLPSDITGYITLENSQKMDLLPREEFRHGPIFAYVVLIDEINRTTPKVQSATLEAMAEKHVTVDQQPYSLGNLFFVIATQNPLDHKGTYALPAAQLDRFLFKVNLLRMTRDDVLKVMTKDSEDPKPEVRASAIIKAIETIKNSVASDDIIAPLLDIREAIIARVGKDIREESIPSARSLQRFIKALKVSAFVRAMQSNAELNVEIEDIKPLARDFFRHRIYPCEDRVPEEMDKLVDELVKDGLEINVRGSHPS